MLKDGVSNFLVSLYLFIGAAVLNALSYIVTDVAAAAAVAGEAPNFFILAVVDTVIVIIVEAVAMFYIYQGMSEIKSIDCFQLKLAYKVFFAVMALVAVNAIVSIVYLCNQALVVQIISLTTTTLATFSIAVAFSFVISAANDSLAGFGIDSAMAKGKSSIALYWIAAFLALALGVTKLIIIIPDYVSIPANLLVMVLQVVAYVVNIVFFNIAMTKIEQEDNFIMENIY